MLSFVNETRNVDYGYETEEIQVKTKVFKDILEEENIKHIDYLSLDVEGHELNVLKGIDFNKVRINVLTIENNPPSCVIYGDENIRKFQKKYIQEEASKIADKHNGSVELNFLEGAPVVMNDIFLTQNLELSALKFFGKNAIVDIPRRMGAEDFAFYSHQIPACFARLGSGNKQKGITASLHNESFDVDEDCIKIGIELMCVFAFSQLS